MAVVKVKSHYQVTLSPQIRAKAGVVVGDLFEAKVEGRTITLVRKRLIDHELRWRSTTSSVVGSKVRFPPFTRQFVHFVVRRHDCVLHAPRSQTIPQSVRRASHQVCKQLTFLLATLRHPSFPTKKYGEANNIWASEGG